MIKIRGFAHSALRVDDAERSKAFYEKVLGLKKLTTRPDFGFPGAWYGVGTNPSCQRRSFAATASLSGKMIGVPGISMSMDPT